MTGIPVRSDVAMTGEITLRGRVLPIGGLKEKLLAALRGGIKKVLIPEENAKDLAEIPDNVKSGMEIVPVAADGRGAEARAGAHAGADRMGRAGRAGGAVGRRRRRCGGVNLRALTPAQRQAYETKAGPSRPAFLLRKPGKSRNLTHFSAVWHLGSGTTLSKVRVLPVEFDSPVV